MTAKRYLANDMSRALKKVREELGPDAIILSSKRVPQGVEIVATLDVATPSAAAAAKQRFVDAFDEEYDQPLNSDTEWGAHHQAEQIAAQTRVSAIAERPKMTERAHTEQMMTPRPAPASRAAAATSNTRTTTQNTRTTTQNAERLAEEIQQAHERMLAAKAQTSVAKARAPVVNTPSVSASFSRLDLPLNTASSQNTLSSLQNTISSPQNTMAHNRQVAGFAEQVRARGIDDQRDHLDQNKLHSLYDEIAEMRMMLEEQLWQKQYSATPADSKLTGRAKQLANQLAQLGLPQTMIQELLVCANDAERLPNCWRKSLVMLAQRIPIDVSDPIEKGGRFAFVGPTGVGKTTTIAKLAARYVLNHGRGKVAIVTTDTYRVGAHDQLKALGRILQVPVRVISGEDQLAAVLTSLKQYPLVLIDTAGFRQGDTKLAQQEALLDACDKVQRILVLAANSQQQILKASLHAYSGRNLRGCIFTKLDECASLGEAFGAVCSTDTPLLYSAAGQEIPDDIHIVSATDLIAQAVKLARQNEGGLVSSLGAVTGSV
ncbi:MAG: flagellar biosynthesis protein FlhF [Marinagarivorans sp.]|nr:flagellar biosynthesis protein FlhF [Marinagarivorans sp.]